MSEPVFTEQDARIHLMRARSLLGTLKRQGPHPTWDFPRHEMEGRMKMVEWHLRMARNILLILEVE